MIRDPDADLARTARDTLRAFPPDRLTGFVKSGRPAEEELDLLARETNDPFVLEEIVRSRSVRGDTLHYLALSSTGRPQEALIANQARLIAQPSLVGALLENPELTVEGRRLLAELTEEFFEKEKRRRAADSRRAAKEKAAKEEEESAAEAVPEDLDSPEDLEEGWDLEGAGDESDTEPPSGAAEQQEESLFIGAIYRRIGMMTVSDKIKLAYTGVKEERRVLIGDTNKLIALAVLKSRALSVNEVETFAAMRNLDEEIYRRITASREWMRKPAVVVALIRNPRVPLDLTLPLLKRISLRELRSVFRDRNLAPVLRTTARRFLTLKRR